MASTRKRLEALTAALSLPSEHAKPAVETSDDRFGSAGMPVAAAVVETGFPPARTGIMAPKTGPGQMLAFRGQIQQSEDEMAALRARLLQYEGALPTRKMDPKTIRPSRWANRHEASFATSEFISLKADMEHAGGNVQAILVRSIPAEKGQFEIVFGHRRHRAALELGIPVLASIWMEELGDAALFTVMDRENRERADLSAYEQGVMYQRALDESLFPTQRQLAEALGVSHTWVRKAMSVAQLPRAVIDCFRTPLEVSFRHAELIHAALETDRRGVLKRAEKVRGMLLTPALVVARLKDAKPGFEKVERLDLLVGGELVGVLARSKAGEVTISLSAGTVTGSDVQQVAQAIGEALIQLRARG
jgi:ParB family chromosome partitioning protein